MKNSKSTLLIIALLLVAVMGMSTETNAQSELEGRLIATVKTNNS